MEPVLRAAGVYIFLLLVFRITGKRSLAQITAFDFILLLIVSEATQNAMTGNNYSLTNCFLVIITLVVCDIILAWISRRYALLDAWINDVPLIVVENGAPIADRMKKSRLEDEDILEAARRLQGLERMDQIQYAVLERSGGISIIPKRSADRS